MLLGAFMAQTLLQSEAAIAISGLLGLGVGILLMRRRMHALQQDAQWQPHIVADATKSDN